MTDPIADMLTRIRNAQAVLHKTVIIPFSKFKFNLAEILEKEGLIGKISIQGRKTRKTIKVELKYDNNKPIISSIKRISKQGQRIYIKKDKLRPIRQGYGFVIISTSQGLMTNKEANKKGLGGELICEVY